MDFRNLPRYDIIKAKIDHTDSRNPFDSYFLVWFRKDLAFLRLKYTVLKRKCDTRTGCFCITKARVVF